MVNNSIDKIQQNVEESTASKTVQKKRSFTFEITLLFITIGFIVLAFLAHIFPYFSFDLFITKKIQTFNPVWMNGLMQSISWIGYLPQSAVIILLIVGIMYFLKLKIESIMLLLLSFSAILWTDVVKIIIARPRPSEGLVAVSRKLTDMSFPSGHVLFYTAFFGFIWYIVFIKFPHSLIRNVLLVILALLIIGIAPSRIFLGNHWFSDTVGGYILGSICLLVAIHVYHIVILPKKKTI
jgi:undecaprenyl-diphosphatase